VVVTVVALQSPMLRIPPEPPAPPIAVIPVLLLPRTPPAAGQQKPAPIRLHRRPQPFIPPEVRPAPIAPPAPASGPPAPPTPKGPVATFHPAPLPEGPKGDLRSALRHSGVGCANQEAVGLNKAERDLCDQKLGDVRGVTVFAPGTEMTAEKKRLLDAQAAQREADYRYKHENTGPPPNQGALPTAGATAEDMCKGLGIPPEKCGYKK
jgi:hypothetical protein